MRTSENSVKANFVESPFHALRWDRDGVRVCTSGEDEQDEHDVDYDVHQPAVGVHPVAHLGHRLLAATKGTAPRREASSCKRFTPTVMIILNSEGNTESSSNPVVNAVVGLAFCRAPSHLGGSLVSRRM